MWKIRKLVMISQMTIFIVTKSAFQQGNCTCCKKDYLHSLKMWSTIIIVVKLPWKSNAYRHTKPIKFSVMELSKPDLNQTTSTHILQWCLAPTSQVKTHMVILKNCFGSVDGMLLCFNVLVEDVNWPLLTTSPGRHIGNSHNYYSRTRQEGLGPESTQKGTGENYLFLKGCWCRGRRHLARACNVFVVRFFLFCWLHFFLSNKDALPLYVKMQ